MCWQMKANKIKFNLAKCTKSLLNECGRYHLSSNSKGLKHNEQNKKYIHPNHNENALWDNLREQRRKVPFFVLHIHIHIHRHTHARRVRGLFFFRTLYILNFHSENVLTLLFGCQQNSGGNDETVEQNMGNTKALKNHCARENCQRIFGEKRVSETD